MDWYSAMPWERGVFALVVLAVWYGLLWAAGEVARG